MNFNCFKFHPASFSLDKNESIIINAKFSPHSSGCYVQKIFIICENNLVKEFVISGDGIFLNSSSASNTEFDSLDYSWSDEENEELEFPSF